MERKETRLRPYHCQWIWRDDSKAKSETDGITHHSLSYRIKAIFLFSCSFFFILYYIVKSTFNPVTFRLAVFCEVKVVDHESFSFIEGMSEQVELCFAFLSSYLGT